MSINYRCPKCNTPLSAPEDMAGKKTVCPNPKCKTKHHVPGGEVQKPEGQAGPIEELVDVQCAACGHRMSGVVFRPGMKCTECASPKVAPVIEEKGIPKWKQNLKRNLAIIGVCFVMVVSMILYTCMKHSSAGPADWVMACPSCGAVYVRELEDVAKPCKKCGAQVERASYCRACGNIFANSAAKKDKEGRRVCPKCASPDITTARPNMVK